MATSSRPVPASASSPASSWPTRKSTKRHRLHASSRKPSDRYPVPLPVAYKSRKSLPLPSFREERRGFLRMFLGWCSPSVGRFSRPPRTLWSKKEVENAFFGLNQCAFHLFYFSLHRKKHPSMYKGWRGKFAVSAASVCCRLALPPFSFIVFSSALTQNKLFYSSINLIT